MSLIAAVTKSATPGQTLGTAPTAQTAATAATTLTKKVIAQDTGAAIKASLAGLKANIKNITSIKVTDGTSLSFTAAELKTYGDVIGKISGNVKITATAVDAASLPAILKNKKVTAIEISDTSAHLEASMGSMIANNSKITSVTRSDATVMKITSSNYASANASTSNNLFSKFAGDLTAKLDVTGVSTGKFDTTIADTKVHQVSISDTLSNIVDASAKLTTGIAKIDTVKASTAQVAKSMTASDYEALKLRAALQTKITAGNANALKNAFSVTGATVAQGTTYAAEANVKSISIKDTITNVPAAGTVSTKVVRMDLTGTSSNLSTKLADVMALGTKLGSVKVTDADTLSLDAANIRDKAGASALAKMTGKSNSPLTLDVTGAKLADMRKLLANKQISTAAVSDTAENLLAFSSDAFASLPATVSITIADNAANVSKNSADLIAAIGLHQQKIALNVTDTAANLGTNIDGLQAVATAISGDTPDTANIHIHQVDAGGVADITSNIKVTLAQYTSAKSILDYAKDAGGDGVIEHSKNVEIDFGDTVAGLNAAKQAGYEKALFADTAATAYDPIAGDEVLGSVARTSGTAKAYADVAKFDLTINSTMAAAAAAYTAVALDTDLAALATTGATTHISVLV